MAAQPTDAVRLGAFALNPALPLAAGVFTLAAGIEPQRRLQTLDQDGVPQTALTRSRLVVGAARSAKVGGDLTITVDGEAAFISADGKKLGYRSRYLAGRVATPLAAGLQAGLLLHAYAYDVAKLKFGDGVQSDTKGYALGAGAGILFGDKPVKALSLYYLPTMRGTSEAEGEHRVLVRSGLAGLDGTMPVGEGVLGLGMKVSSRSQEANGDADPGDVEAGTLGTPDVSLSAGYDDRFGTNGFWRAAAGREFYESTQNRAVTTEVATRLKAELGRRADAVESAIGASLRLGAPILDLVFYGMLSFKS